jgi:GT2 family glycosyltransferase
VHDYQDSIRYARWIASYDTLDHQERARVVTAVVAIQEPTLFSLVLCPVDELSADRALRSLVAQLYPFWEVWIAEQDLPNWAEDPRIKTVPRSVERSGHLAYATDLAIGQFISPMTVDISLSQRALYDMYCAISESPAGTIFYSDEDELDARGHRRRPWLKTGWDPDLMLARNAIGQLATYRSDVLKRLPVIEELGSEAQIYAIALRATWFVPPSSIVHVQKLLAHRSIAQSRPSDLAKVVARFLSETGSNAKVTEAPLAPQWNRVIWPVLDPLPRVSVILPTRDGAALLARSTSAVLDRTEYGNVELLIVDNGTVEPEALSLLARLRETPNVRLLSHPGPFNYAAMNNRAAAAASGEILMLLNNDTDALSPGWLREMVSQACRPDVGIVGAKLLYQDGRVQHAGIVFNEEMDIIHQLRLSEGADPGCSGELALVRNVLAVTGAALCIRKDVYFEIGQMDEVSFPVGFNDIDLCLRAGDHGYRVLFTPFAALTHFESATLGSGFSTSEHRDRYLTERSRFHERWVSVVSTDRFHNPNLSYQWSKTELAAPPRRQIADRGLSSTMGQVQLPTAQRWSMALQRLSMTRIFSENEAVKARATIASVRASEAAAFDERSNALKQLHVFEKSFRALEVQMSVAQTKISLLLEQQAAKSAHISFLSETNRSIVESTTWRLARWLQRPITYFKQIKPSN